LASIAPDNPPGDSDWTSSVRVGYDVNADFYITGYTSGQWSVGPRDAHIRATVVSDGLVVYQRGEQEPGAAGVTDARAFRRLCAGYRSSLVRSSENKEIRAGPVASEIEGGRFFIVDDGSGWADRLLANLSRTDFKSGHDDDADALAVAYDWLAIYVLSETGEGAEDAPGPPVGDAGDDDGSLAVVDYS
jgi:phage terminase large subunit-like protein